MITTEVILNVPVCKLRRDWLPYIAYHASAQAKAGPLIPLNTFSERASALLRVDFYALEAAKAKAPASVRVLGEQKWYFARKARHLLCMHAGGRLLTERDVQDRIPPA